MSEISSYDDDVHSSVPKRMGNTEYEPLNNYDEHLANEDSMSSTADDDEADGIFYKEKKRSATVEDENPGATKKIKEEWEDEQVPAARHQPRLPDLILDAKNDHNYLQFMNEAIKKIDGVEFSTRAEKEMGKTILHKIKRDYRVLDADGSPLQDDVALHNICMYLRSKYYDEKKSSLPTMILNMRMDTEYDRIMTETFAKVSKQNFDGTVEETCDEVLEEIRKRYHLLDKDKKSISDEEAKKKMVLCIRNQHYRPKPSKTTVPSPVRARVATTCENNIILDMRIDKKIYKDTIDRFLKDYANNKYDDIVEMGEAILRELQRRLGTHGKFHKKLKIGHEEVNSDEALQIIYKCLNQHMKKKPEKRICKGASPRRQSRTRDYSVEIQEGHNLSEANRLDLLDYFGNSIIVDFLKKKDSFGWKFQRIRGQVEDTWVAVKKGVTNSNTKEGDTMLTGVRKIANWASREGLFKEYANTDIGRNTLERKGLSVDNYMIIFDKELEERSGAVSRRNARSNSSSSENEEGRSNVTLQLRGEELKEYTSLYIDIATKHSQESDVNAKKFYGLLQKCLEKKMINTQQWNAKKLILAQFLEHFENEVKDAAAICQMSGTTWFKDGIIPAIIEDAKEKLLDA